MRKSYKWTIAAASGLAVLTGAAGLAIFKPKTREEAAEAPKSEQVEKEKVAEALPEIAQETETQTKREENAPEVTEEVAEVTETQPEITEEAAEIPQAQTDTLTKVMIGDLQGTWRNAKGWQLIFKGDEFDDISENASQVWQILQIVPAESIWGEGNVGSYAIRTKPVGIDGDYVGAAMALYPAGQMIPVLDEELGLANKAADETNTARARIFITQGVQTAAETAQAVYYKIN